jgi:hypothetical protein
LDAEKTEDIAREQDALQAEYAEKYRQLAVDLAGKLSTDPAPPPAPSLDFSPLTPAPQTLDLSMLPAQAQASAERMTGTRRQAVQEIDQTIATLVAQRQQLHARMAEETRAAVEAVAAQHGYAVRFSAGAGPEITDAARKWLQEYWTGQ